MKNLKFAAMAGALLLAAAGAGAQTTVKHLQPNEKAFIADGVWAGDTLYLSGQLAEPGDAGRCGDR